MAGRIAVLTNLLRTNPVRNIPSEKAFAIDFERNRAAVFYEYDDGVYDLVHSEIPSGFQGHGLGSIVAERVFDHLVKSNKKFRVTCDFLRTFYERNESRYSSNVVE